MRFDPAAAVAIIVAAGVLAAQTPTSPAFEVASVKANTSGPQAPQRLDMRPGDRVTINNVPLRVLIQTAYRLAAARILGGPNWIVSDRFDINAKADAPTSQNQLELMLRTLLADRFKRVVHTETRNTQIYALVLARRDGRLGPNLKPASADCATLRAAAEPSQRGTTIPCGFVTQPGILAMRGVALDQIAGFLSTATNPIKAVNMTGLTGFFDFELKWTPEAFRQRPFDPDRPRPIDPDGPSIFTAVQEQLGLKLESQRDDGEFLVIDRVEHPTED
jgi:uncharacterized protein (TIGR03435 family)